jgi:hypothetical protein
MLSKIIMKKLKIDKNYSVRYDNTFGIVGKNFEKYKYYLLYAENSKEVEEKVNEYVDMKNKPYIIYFVFPKALGKKVNLTKQKGFEHLETIGYEKANLINLSKSYWALGFFDKEESERQFKKELDFLKGIIDKGWD